MSALFLSLIRCPDRVPPETRHVGGGEFTIGRGPDNDWVLPDPERHLSKRHCALQYRAGAWQLADLSTNGTYVNADPEPVGPGQPRALRDGDRLRLGPYEIELRIEAETQAPYLPGADPFADPFAAEYAAPEPGRRGDLNPFLDEDLAPPADAPVRLDARSSVTPDPADPFAPADDDFLPHPTQPDHAPSVEDAFRPPVAASVLPDDWDLDLTPAKSVAPETTPESAPESAPAFAPPALAAPSVTPAEPPARAAAAESGDLMDAFLRGAGMEGARPADPVAAMESLGAAFRALVAGLRQALIARAAIKGEFRIEQTMIRARGNNPLKFSAGDDDALAALLGAGRRTDVLPAAAVEDALRDIRLHELAVMSAMQSAVRALMERLDPAALRREAEAGGLSLVALQRKARAWDAYEALHARTAQALADDFDSVFGKAFALAYERALREAQARDRAGEGGR